MLQFLMLIKLVLWVLTQSCKTAYVCTCMCVLLVGTWQRDLSTWRQVEKRFPRPIPGLEADSVATGFTRRKQVHAQLTVIGWFCCKVWLGNLNGNVSDL